MDGWMDGGREAGRQGGGGGRQGGREGGREGGEGGERDTGAPVTSQGQSSPATPCVQMDDWLCCDHPEPAVCRPCSALSLCGTDANILPLPWRPRSPLRIVSLVVLQPKGPALVPWELGAGPVPCSSSWSVSLEPAVQSRMEMLQQSAAKIYLMLGNLGRPHMQPRGARALAGAELPPIEWWNRGRGQSRGEGTDCLRWRRFVFAHGNALSIAKALGAVSKPALEHFVVVWQCA